MKLGRNRPVVDHPHLKLRNYLYRGLPPAPAAVHWTPAPLGLLEDPLGNLKYGDCVFAGMFHMWDVWAINAGAKQHARPTEADALCLYSRVTGFNPSDPSTDKGGDLQTALAYVQKNGAFASGAGKVAGWVSVDAHDLEMCRFAIWAFGALYGGYELPDDWLKTPPSANGWLWAKAGAPNPANGHCTVYPAYNENEFVVSTWGMIGGEANEAFAYYHAKENGGELWAPLSPDWINQATQKAPSGFDWTQLQADLQATG